MAADLKRAETLRSNLMADVSHELRTPLTVLEGNLRAALDHIYPGSGRSRNRQPAQPEPTTSSAWSMISAELALAETDQLPLEKQPTDLNRS